MPRVRLVYRQEGQARFVSHLDVMRAFERAARRAGLPLVYSQGFNPRPKLVFAAPLPVGTSGCREYVDMELEGDLSPDEVLDRLRRNLPGGLVPVAARSAAGPPLMSLVGRACYLAAGKLPRGLSPEHVEEGLARFLARGEIVTERKTAKGTRRKNIRPGIHRLRARSDGDRLELTMELEAGSARNVRPDEVLQALGVDLGLDAENFAVLRTAVLSREGFLLWDL